LLLEPKLLPAKSRRDDEPHEQRRPGKEGARAGAKTEANGASPAEAAQAAVAIKRLEAKLGFEVAPAVEQRAKLGLRGRVYQAMAAAYQSAERTAERRRAEAMAHIIGLRA
jgi:hypothetical protein